MATAEYGIAYLDLAGNRVVWSPLDTTHDNIRLDGSHFHEIVRLIPLVISAMCLVAFCGIVIAVCGVCFGRQNTSKYLPWSTVWVPMFCMIGYFIFDIGNRVFHELEGTISSAYIGIDIVIGSLSSIADGLLMIYLSSKSPVDPHQNLFSTLAMTFAIIIYFLISLASKGTQIWSLMVQNESDGGSSSTDSSSSDDSSNFMVKSVEIFQDLSSAASGMLLLFAIGFAIFSITFIRRLSKNYTLRRRLTRTVGVLAASFLIRNAVKFAFTLMYSQFNNNPSLHVQLIYNAVYGPLSVVIFVCILVIAAAQDREEPISYEPKYGEVQQMPASAGGPDWPQDKPQMKVSTTHYPGSDGNYPYHYENANQQRW